jgi:hypothetical protein
MDAEHTDAHAPELRGEPLGELDHGRLGDGIARDKGPAEHAGLAGDVQDAAPPPGDHAGLHLPAAGEQPAQVDLHGVPTLTRVDFPQWADGSVDPGVVDRGVHRARACRQAPTGHSRWRPCPRRRRQLRRRCRRFEGWLPRPPPGGGGTTDEADRRPGTGECLGQVGGSRDRGPRRSPQRPCRPMAASRGARRAPNLTRVGLAARKMGPSVTPANWRQADTASIARYPGGDTSVGLALEESPSGAGDALLIGAGPSAAGTAQPPCIHSWVK